MYKKYVLLFLLACGLATFATAQTNPADSLKVPPADSLGLPATESLQAGPNDSLQTKPIDTLAVPARQSDINTTVNYSASDSLRFDVRDKTAFMYGDAKVDYGQIKLEAAHITTNWETTLLTATGAPDSAGKIVGKPVFTDGPEQFVTDNIRYNFKTKKAIIKGIVTQQQEAYIHGETVKKGPDNELFISKARYTTRNLEDPHFHIEAERLKVLPNDKVISGPFHLKIADVSTPLGFLFGMFPAPRKRVSGILVPSYGEERNRGFFLREGGYYWALNDYVDLAVTGEIYSKGSRGIALASNYRKRYAYNGNVNVRYNRQNTGTEGLENVSNDLWVTWSHAPQTKGKGRFTASVNGGTRSYTTNNPSIQNIDRNLTQQFNSNVSYSYSNIANSPFSLTSRARMVQDITTGAVDLTLPDLGITMNRQQPFKKAGSSGKSWYEQIGVGYTFSATNQITNKFRPPSTGFNVLNPDPLGDTIVPFNAEFAPLLWERARAGARHSIPISTSFNLLKHLQVSPSFNYEEYWFLKKLRYTDFDPVAGGVAIDTLDGFSRAGIYNANVSLGTKLFGTFYFNKRNKRPFIQAIRHMMIPSLSFSYSPDFSEQRYGLIQDVVTGYDKENNPVRKELSPYAGFAYTPRGGAEAGRLNFNLTNNIEMKVRDKSDTVKGYKKVPLIRNLSIGTSYNLIAEDFNLEPVRLSGNTSLLNNLISLNFGATLDPYAYRLDSVYYTSNEERRVVDERINTYAWDIGQGIGQITQANFGITTSLSSATFKKGGSATTKAAAPNTRGTPLGGPGGETTIDEEEAAYIYSDPNEYVDFTLPWTLRFNYTFNYSKLGFKESTIRQAAQFSGDLKVTDKWKVGFNSGYDFQNHEFTQTRLSIYRDLHCWQMNVNWVPFGTYQSFSVDINVKASILQDLKLSRRRTWFDN